MKKRILLTALLLLLSFSLLLSSCSKAEDAKEKDPKKQETQKKNDLLADLYDPDWKPEEIKLVSAKQHVGGTTLQTWNDHVAIFTDMKPYQITSIYSFAKGTAIRNFIDSAVKKHYANIHVTNGGSVFAVLTTTVEKAEDYLSGFTSSYFSTQIPSNASLEVALYNLEGEKIYTLTHEDIGTPYNLDNTMEKLVTLHGNSNLFSIGDKLYRENEDGSTVLLKEFVWNEVPDFTMEFAGYYYDVLIDYNTYTLQALTIYNSEFAGTAHLTLPSYAKNVSGDVLNNGDALIQYRVSLPNDASEYDLYLDGAKYELVTQILSAADGTLKTIDANYLLRGVYAKDYDFETPEAFAETVENIATVCYVNENKTVDLNTQDSVLMDNNGTVLRSIKLSEYSTEMPQRLDTDLYYDHNAFGEYVLFNGKYETLLTSSKYPYDDYLLRDDKIYDLRGNLLYDLKANGASIYSTLNGTLLLCKETNVDGTLVQTYQILKMDGTVTEIGTLGGENATIMEFDYFYNYYYLLTPEGSYLYYNAYGEKLISSDTRLTAIHDEEFVLLGDENGIYYEFNYNIRPNIEK
ncbi:MAG: hypothetical protein IJW30_06570 [Clostridia bacterium]|nr:hypothetical protein [Clostridia bacterium]MBQ9774312.1 hypothetical protein [Clostridia bacterium]